MKRRLGDRRLRPRFEIVGELWGSLETSLPLSLRNVGEGGALFESLVPFATDSSHRLSWAYEEQQTVVQVRVSHVRPIETTDGMRYLVGIEFLALNPLIAGQIQQRLLGAGI
jgi:hypothetical protein